MHYGTAAGIRLQAIEAACRLSTGQQNSWKDKGDEYHFEIGKSQRDGAIVGTIYRQLRDDSGKCRKCNSLRIESNGTWNRGPAWMKHVPAYMLTMIPKSGSKWQTLYTGEVSDAGLMAEMVAWVDSFKPGGPNEMLQGEIPYPVKATIRNLDTNTNEVEWNMPMFFVWESSLVESEQHGDS